MRAAVAYLAKSSEDAVGDLERSLALLRRNFLSRYRYPVILFHEPDFTDDWKSRAAAALAESSSDRVARLVRGRPSFRELEIRFEPVRFETPAHLRDEPMRDIERWGLGYRHMCRFFSGEMFRHPALADLDYYMRLDTDSFVTGPVRRDPFRFMSARGLHYGYIYCVQDFEPVVEGLWDATREYIEERRIQPRFLDRFLERGEWARYCFYTNFEIGKLDFFRSSEYLSFFDYLDRIGGIYTRRWGDAPIRLLGISLFMSRERTHMFRDIPYKHWPLEISRQGRLTCPWGPGHIP